MFLCAFSIKNDQEDKPMDYYDLLRFFTFKEERDVIEMNKNSTSVIANKGQ